MAEVTSKYSPLHIDCIIGQPYGNIDSSYSCGFHTGADIPQSGVSVQNAELTLWRQNKKLTQYVGDLLFTHKGISGPVIINTSRWMEVGDQLTINYLYPKTYEEVRKEFSESLAQRGKEEVITFLKPLKLP